MDLLFYYLSQFSYYSVYWLINTSIPSTALLNKHMTTQCNAYSIFTLHGCSRITDRNKTNEDILQTCWILHFWTILKNCTLKLGRHGDKAEL